MFTAFLSQKFSLLLDCIGSIKQLDYELEISIAYTLINYQNPLQNEDAWETQKSDHDCVNKRAQLRYSLSTTG